jgi:hypothetical protein
MGVYSLFNLITPQSVKIYSSKYLANELLLLIKISNHVSKIDAKVNLAAEINLYHDGDWLINFKRRANSYRNKESFLRNCPVFNYRYLRNNIWDISLLLGDLAEHYYLGRNLLIYPQELKGLIEKRELIDINATVDSCSILYCLLKMNDPEYDKVIKYIVENCPELELLKGKSPIELATSYPNPEISNLIVKKALEKGEINRQQLKEQFPHLWINKIHPSSFSSAMELSGVYLLLLCLIGKFF